MDEWAAPNKSLERKPESSDFMSVCKRSFSVPRYRQELNWRRPESAQLDLRCRLKPREVDFSHLASRSQHLNALLAAKYVAVAQNYPRKIDS